MKKIKFKDFDNNENIVSEYDMKRLALFNLTLDPIPEETEIVGYLGALDNYYMANDDELKTIYDAVKLSYFGKKYYANLLEDKNKIISIIDSKELENEVKTR